MKKCTWCKQLKQETAFNWKQKHLKRTSHCKLCSRELIRSHYKNNTEYYVKKARKRNALVRQRYQDFLADYLKKHTCIDCGENDILVLEFDHKNPSTKVEAIAIMMRQQVAIKKLKAEIEKCNVRCANCHRRKTAQENNSWRLKYAPVAQGIEQ